MESTKAAMSKAPKEAYNRTLEKARIDSNETSLKGWFCFWHVPLH
jgi:hypothetical protein